MKKRIFILIPLCLIAIFAVRIVLLKQRNNSANSEKQNKITECNNSVFTNKMFQSISSIETQKEGELTTISDKNKVYGIIKELASLRFMEKINPPEVYGFLGLNIKTKDQIYHVALTSQTININGTFYEIDKDIYDCIITYIYNE